MVAASLIVAAATAQAQTGAVVEGAPELLLSSGARAVGMGEAVAATASGADALWWNPALVARSSRQVGFAIGKEFGFDADAGASLIYPVQHAFTVGVSIRYLNEGQQDATFQDPNAPQGTIDLSGLILGATFAAPFGDRLVAGVTAKVFRINFACTGACNTNAPSTAPTDEALDVGAHYFVRRDSSLSVGIVLRDVGFKFQIQDPPQADLLPSRLDVGVQVVPHIERLPKDQRVIVAADVISRLLSAGGPGFRVGGEWSWQGRVEARAGYVQSGPMGSGPTFGLGIAAGKWQVDVAQMLTDLGVGIAPPTFISLQCRF